MDRPKFIDVQLLDSPTHQHKIIAIDNIASIEPDSNGHTRMVLKEVVGGKSVEIMCVEEYADIAIKIGAF